MLLLPLNLDCFLRDHPSQYQAVQFSGGTSSAEYTSESYDNLCDRLGVVQAMGRVGSALDNAAAESFNSLIKVEYIHRHHFATRAEARLKIATWNTDFYNTRRRHSAANGLPPTEFERIISGARASRLQEGLAA